MNVQAVVPLVEELEGVPDAATVFTRLSHLPHCLFLDSAMRYPRLGRYSFVAADPFDYLQLFAQQEAFGPLEAALGRFRTATVPGLATVSRRSGRHVWLMILAVNWRRFRDLLRTSLASRRSPSASTTSSSLSIIRTTVRGFSRAACPNGLPMPKATERGNDLNGSRNWLLEKRGA